MRERLSLNHKWRFHLGDIPFPKLKSHSDSYSNAKAGRAFGAAAPEHDDTEWLVVDAPHDWAIESTVDPKENLSQGFRARGIGWYRRHFRLDPQDRGRHFELQFDGVATHCTVWFNGSIVHRNFCGYTSFYIDITPFAKFGEELNTIAIRVDADAMEGWWYEGAGIYRHTWLVKRNATHIITDGVYANPIRQSNGLWTLPVEATLYSAEAPTSEIRVVVELLDAEGHVVEKGRAETCAELTSLQQVAVSIVLQVAAPCLWSVADPCLYQVRTSLFAGDKELDSVTTTCGFRTLRFDADTGFYLNEKPMKLKGVCNHQDHAGVGVAMPDSLWEFRLRRLKEMGVNAYRCAHNPPPKEMLDLCDRLGILVMDENRHFNSSPEYIRQLEWLVRRDRNHPSIILWSVFNEEPMQGSEVGYEMVRRMSSTVRRLDSTRPVTAAMNGGLFSPVNVSQAVDVVGFNYQTEFYDSFHEANPGLPMTSAEDTSAFMTRGEYETAVEKNIRGSYDTEFAPWGISHREAWQAIAKRPFLAGGFVWTGFDYHGEPTPHQWPSNSSFFGCLDLCGFPKAAFHMHRAHWMEDSPVLELIPHWTWPGREGEVIQVMAISNATKAELFLNGCSLGEKSVDPYQFVSWQVAYTPGSLEVIARNNGRDVALTKVETTGLPVRLKLYADRPSLAGDGSDAQPITVKALDGEDRPVPTANMRITFEIEVNKGRIIGLGNGDPNSVEPEKGNSRSIFNGLAQVIIQSVEHAFGSLLLRASAEGLDPAELQVEISAAPSPASLTSADPILYLQGWRMSPIASSRPNPNVEVADNDMNTWPGIQPGEVQSFAHGSFAVYRLKFCPFAAIQKNGGQILFRSITGRAEVWIDGELQAEKTSFEPAPIEVRLPPKNGLRTISILIQAAHGRAAGLSGQISVRNA